MGHVVESKLTPDPDCASGDRTDTAYDGIGHVYTVSNPYCTTSDSTYGITTYSYNALGRTTKVTNPDSSTVLTTFAGRATEVQDEGNGASRVTRISQSDGLGRLLSLCEVSSISLIGAGGTPGACGQDIAGTGFLTSYQYNTLDNLTSVSMSGLNPRTFTYDSLSRLTSATNPESGQICYGTVSGGACQANGYDANGNLAAKTDARRIQTTYSYDAVNRLKGKTYSDGTPAATVNYDQSSALGVTLINTVGRKSSESTVGPNVTGSVFSYDQMGRVANNSQCSPQNCGTGVFAFQYTQYDPDPSITRTCGSSVVGEEGVRAHG
jgi:YD repeat-containing protein